MKKNKNPIKTNGMVNIKGKINGSQTYEKHTQPHSQEN